MKKALFTFVVVAVIVLVGINVINAFAHTELTDTELMTKYIEVNYEGDCYGIVDQDHTDDQYIKFTVYEHGMECGYVGINREYYQNLYE